MLQRLLFIMTIFSFTLQANTSGTLIDKSQSSHLAYKIVESLTTEVGPRIPGSDGDKKAVVWAENKFSELGFDKVYKQPVKVRNWSRGKAHAKLLAPYQHTLAVTALGGSVGTGDNSLVGNVAMFNTLADLIKADKSQVTDKIVFINHPMQRDRAGKFYGPTVKGRANGATEAAKLGAKAIIIRSIGTDMSRFPHTGMMRYGKNVKRIPAAALSTVDADLLARVVKQTNDVSLSLAVEATEGKWQTSYNVIGEITGSNTPEEIILLGAHLDSWDEGTGALDDGAGVGIVMAAAHLVKSVTGQPQRTIRVVLYASEEFGLVGAHQYVRTNKQDLANIVVAIESDFGAGRIYQLDTRFSNASLKQLPKLYRTLASLGIKKGNNDTGGGPDISMLPNHGVPVAALKQDGTYYFDYHHTANDTLDKVDIAAITQNQTAYVVFADFMANTVIDPRQ